MEKFTSEPRLAVQVVSPQDWRAEIELIPFLSADTADILLRERCDARQELLIPIKSHEKPNAEDLRQAGGKAARWLLDHPTQIAGIRLTELDHLGAPEAVSPFCQGLLLGGFL